MMSKVFITGKSFGETCKYLCLDLERAQVLRVEGVRGHDYRLMEQDFELQHRLMPEKEKPVFHGMLSFPPGEDPGNEKMVEIARKYLQEIEMVNTQYAIIKHVDKAHLHLHIMANRVDNEGRIIGKGLIAERGMKAAKKLTREYGLRAEQGKNLKLTNFNALHSNDAKRYRLYEAIKDDLPGCRRIEDLEKKLLARGITTRYKSDEESGERCGISFRIENHSFKGSQVDPAYSFRKLEKTIGQQREQLDQQLKMEQNEKLRLKGERLRPEDEGKKISQELKEEARQEEQRIEHSLRRGLHL